MPPIVKWVGGKGKLIPNILERVPGQFHAYHEPFVGGGAVLEAMLKSGKCTEGKVFASDANSKLIAMYSAIKSDVDTLIHDVEELFKDQTGDTYYAIRKEFNKTPKPAQLIYLNKTCFNGLYRENSSGEFNVSWGKGQRISFKKDDFQELSRLYNQYDVQFQSMDWKEAVQRVQPNDFIYLDPPYVKLKDTTFTSYTQDGFNAKESGILIKWARETPAVVLYSNHATDEVKQALDGWNFWQKSVHRAVNGAKVSVRAEELLAYKI